MKKLLPLFVLLVVAVAYGGTTLRQQDLSPTKTDVSINAMNVGGSSTFRSSMTATYQTSGDVMTASSTYAGGFPLNGSAYVLHGTNGKWRMFNQNAGGGIVNPGELTFTKGDDFAAWPLTLAHRTTGGLTGVVAIGHIATPTDPLYTLNVEGGILVGDAGDLGYIMATGSATFMTGIRSGGVLTAAAASTFVGAATFQSSSTFNNTVGISSAVATEALGVTGNINISGVYKQGTTAGVSRTCATGEFLDTQITKGGIITSGTCTTAGSGATVAGSNTQVQYNNNGAFGASGDFTWHNNSGQLTIAQGVSNSTTGQMLLTLKGNAAGATVGSGPMIAFRSSGNNEFFAKIRAYAFGLTGGGATKTGLAFETGTESAGQRVNMVINEDGYVGISTRAPQMGLDVNSGALFRSSVTVQSDLFAYPVSSQTIQTVDWTSNNTTFVNCVTTLTVTTDGLRPIHLVFNGHLTNAGTAESTFATIFQDGSFISPFSQTLAMAFYKDGNGGNVGGDDVTISLVTTPSAGTHSYCMAFRGTGGITWTVENDQKPSIFRVEGAR